MEVLLFSGGIESTCLAYIRRPDVCLTIDYGQRQAAGEISASINIANHFGLQHAVLRADVSSIGSGEMAGRPTIDSATIPEFWPFRNQLLVTLAAMKYATTRGTRVVLGSVKSDSSHIDGTARFYEALAKVMFMQEGHIEVLAPAIAIESIELASKSKIDADILDMTFSCFVAEYPCGRCRGCRKNEEIRAQYYAMKPTCQISKSR